MKQPAPFTVIIDTNEQRPFFYDKVGDPNFPGMRIKDRWMKTGDYSIEGCDSPECQYSIVIERKSLSDLFGSTGRGRERLGKEFQRMSEFDYAAFVVEADWRTVICSPPETSAMDPKKILRTVIAFCQRYDVHPWFCPDRSFAEKITYLLLKRFWDDRQPGGLLYPKYQHDLPSV